MLTIDNQRARNRKVQFARDGEVSFGRAGSTIRGQSTGRSLRLDRAVAVPARVRAAGAAGAGSAAVLHRQDDGPESGATYALGGPLRGHGASGEESHSPPSLPAALYERGYRVISTGR